jgi:hypothetical protein
MFWLVKQTTHRANPKLLPAEQDLARDIGKGLDSYFAAIRDRIALQSSVTKGTAP